MSMNNLNRGSVLLLSAAVLLASGVCEARWARFALVVGHNDSDDSDLAPLKYADDDAIKYARLFGMIAERTELLVSADKESTRAFGPQKAKRATRANVMAALKSLRRDMRAAKARGDKPVLYFVYSGHGNYDQEGRGYVHLADGRFTTRDMYYEVLGPTEGPYEHHVVLMVDACNAALLVNSRGGSDRRKVRGTSLKLEAYPNVGVVLSSSTVGEVHEWGKFLAGIFSHEVRSALMGPADLNDDSKVTFPELAAFIQSANAAVKNEIYRIKPYIRPPLSAPNMPLVSLERSRFPARIRLGKGVSGRGHLVNNELLRFADFNKADGQSFWLGIPGREGYLLVTEDGEYIVPKGAKGDLALGALKKRVHTVLGKRGTDQYFEKRLFATSHDKGAAHRWLKDQYRESLIVDRFERKPWYDNPGAWSLFGGSIVSLGAAVGFHVTAELAVTDAQDSAWFDNRKSAIDTAERNRTVATVLYSVGGAAAVGSVLWFLLDRRYESSRYKPPLAVHVGPGGVTLSTEF